MQNNMQARKVFMVIELPKAVTTFTYDDELFVHAITIAPESFMSYVKKFIALSVSKLNRRDLI